MRASRQSSAYDYYRSEYSGTAARRLTEQRIHERPRTSAAVVARPRVQRKTRRKAKITPRRALFYGLLVGAVVFLIYSNMQLTLLIDEEVKANYLLDELRAETVALSSKQAYGYDVEQVEQYATARLGMVKLESSRVEYVEIVNPESVTVRSKSGWQRLKEGVASFFSSIAEYIA